MARQKLLIHPKLCHLLPYEVVVSLGLMSSVVIVEGEREVFEREGGAMEGGETKRDPFPYLGDNPVSCWPGG